MISSGRQIAVYALGEPVDMRKSFNTLSALVVELGHEVLSGHFFLFVSRVISDNYSCRSTTIRFAESGAC